MSSDIRDVFVQTYGTPPQLPNRLRSRPRQSCEYSRMLGIRSSRNLLPRLTWVKAAGVRRVQSPDRGLLGLLRFSGHQSTFEDTRTPLVRQLPRWLPRWGSFRVGPTAGRIEQEERPKRHRPGLPHLALSKGAAASPGRQTIASFALSYSRSLRLLRPEGIRMMAAGTGRRLENSITKAIGICER
jgi:hypothetical protein